MEGLVAGVYEFCVRGLSIAFVPWHLLVGSFR